MKKQLRFSLLFALLVTILPAHAQSTASEDLDAKYATELIKVGTAAPDFTMKTPDGTPVCLTEFANVAMRKIGMAPDAVLDFIRMFRNITTVVPECELVVRGVEIKALYGIQFYDAMVVAAAERAKAREIWTEDLNAGQRYCGMLAVNPFG